MRRKYKLTGCARFLIFLIIAVPVIYVSATLITGTSPWDELKLLISGEEKMELIEADQTQDPKSTEVKSDGEESATSTAAKTQQTEQEQLEALLKRIESLEKKIKDLERQLDD